MKKNNFLERFTGSNVQSFPLINQLGAKDIVIDCGANIGDVTSAYLKKGCTVIAFEPNPHCIDFMKRRFKGRKKLFLINKAVSDKVGVSRLFNHKFQNGIEWSSGSSLEAKKGNIDTDKYFEIETLRLSDYIRHLDREINLLKIDIECHEDIVLLDLIQSDAFKRINYAIVEVHDVKYDFMKPRIQKLKKIIASNNLEEKIDLTWH